MADNAPLGFCVGTHSIPKPLSKKMYVAAGLRMDAPLQRAVPGAAALHEFGRGTACQGFFWAMNTGADCDDKPNRP